MQLVENNVNASSRTEMAASEITDHFLSVHEVATRLNVSKSSVFAWAKAGVIPPQRKFGRSSRWSLCELNEWIDKTPQGAYGGKR